MLFWHSLTTDMSQAVFKGVTVVANMTEVHLNGGFNFTVARHLHLFVSKVFPGKMINQVYLSFVDKLQVAATQK